MLHVKACILDSQAQSSRSIIQELRRAGFSPVLALDPQKELDPIHYQDPALWLVDLDASLEVFHRLIHEPRQFLVGITRGKVLPTLELEKALIQGEVLKILHRPITTQKLIQELAYIAQSINKPSEYQLGRERLFNYIQQNRPQDSRLTSEFLKTHLKGRAEGFYYRALVYSQVDKDLDRALEELNQGLRLEPTHGLSLKLKSDLLIHQLRYAEARPIMGLLLNRYEHDIQLHLDYIDTSLKWRDYLLAVQILESILRRKENFQVVPWDRVASTAYQLTEAVFKTIREDSIRLRHLQAISELPLSEEKRVEISNLLIHEKFIDEAEKLITHAPNEMGPLGYLQLGRIYYNHRNQRYRAIEIWKEGYQKTHDDTLFETLREYHKLMGLKFSLS